MKNKVLTRGLAVLLSLAILGVIAAIVYNVAAKHKQEHFTEFYLLGTTGKAEDYTVSATSGQETLVKIGVHNEEGIATGYWIEVRINGVISHEINLPVLSDGQVWESTDKVTFTAPGSGQTAEFYLYRLIDSKPYLGPLRLRVNVVQ